MKYAKVWLLLAILFILVASGAAAGTILSGFLEGGLAMDVSLPLELEEPWVECLPSGQDVLASLNRDRNEFRVVAEVQPGDCFLIHLPVINKADVDIKSLLTLTYPYGVSLWVTGSGVINDVLPASYQAWKFTADVGARGTSASPYDGVRIQVCVSPRFSGGFVEITGSIESASGLGDSVLVLSCLPSEDVLYLHNSASPPTGDRNSQADLPMNMYPPTAAALYNYDKDLNSDPGRTILHGSNGAAETSLDKYQNWQMSVSDDLNIHGNLIVFLWSASKNFDQTQRGTITAHLMDGTIEIGSGTLDLSPWQQGATSWVERRIIINTNNYTIPAGHTLELKVTAGASSGDMWLAYDTVRYPSRLLLGSLPTPDFSASFVESVSGKVTVAFTDSSSSYEGITSWLWNFGDGGTSGERNPRHTYAAAGTYTVSLTVAESDGDAKTAVRTAIVSTSGVTLVEAPPTAAFSATPTYGRAPLKVCFADQSTSSDGIVSWLWNFGDGGASALQNPTHIYAQWGNFTVSLTVGEADGDSNTNTKTNYILVLEPIPPTASTNDATNITLTTVRLNGTLSSLGTASTVDVSFQWGTSPGVYPHETTKQTMSAPGSFYFNLSGLTPGRTYYFRAKAVGHGTSYGLEKSFGTPAMLYLHNNPTPPVGDTNKQANLPMDTSAPTAVQLYNYDVDRDAYPGRKIDRGGSGPNEANIDRYQNWRITLPGNLTINGNVDVTLWSAMKDFATDKRGVVKVYLRDFNGSTYTEIANGTLDLASWQGGSGTWVERTITITGVNYTISSGHILEVKVIVDAASSDHMWFAYDTTGYPSRVILP